MQTLERIRALEVEKEKLTEQVANMRRTAPQKAAEGFRTKWKSEGDVLDVQAKHHEETALQQSSHIAIGELKRWDEVQNTWVAATEGLVRLKEHLTETVAKVERAKTVAEHMENT